MRNKKLVALSLVSLMALNVLGCGKNDVTTESSSQAETSKVAESSTVVAEPVDEFAWLNQGTLPLVEEGTEKTLTMAIRMADDSGNPEDTWAYRFIEEAMNIDIDVTKFTNANINEFVALMFADEELPDVVIGANLSAQNLVKYGAQEGQIIDLAPYITEELTPNLYKVYQEHPEYLQAITDSEGHIWSLGYINDPSDRGQVSRAFLNYDWIEEAGLEVPTTIDELLDVLRAFKERGDDIVPVGGVYKSQNPCLYILNAYGYNTTDAKGMSIALRNGKVVLPVADREAYGAYLETMKTMYDEGLINADFYTLDGTTSNALISADKCGFCANAPFVFTTNFNSWWGVQPLTSEYNDEAFWPASQTSVSAGQFVISADCEEIELAMAFADWLFGTYEGGRIRDKEYYNYNLLTSGPATTQTDYLFGVTGFEEDEEGNITYPDFENNTTKYANKTDYLQKEIQLIPFTVLGMAEPTDHSKDPDITSYEQVSDVRKSDDLKDDGELSFRMGLQETVCKNVETGFPKYVYLDAETMEEAANILTVLQEYAAQESAKFVTGARPLSELDIYFDEMERLGALEYVQIYQDYYDSLQ